MPAKIASTVFKSGPDDTVAAVDVYRAKTAETVNAAKAAVSETVGNGVTAVKEAVTGTVTNAFNDAKKNITDTFSIGNLTKTLKDTIINGELDKDKIKEGLLKNIPTKADAVGRLKDIIGGPLNTISNLENLKTSLVTNLLGSIGFTDNPEALAKGLLGLPGGTDPINVLLDGNPNLKMVYGGVKFAKDIKNMDDAKALATLANAISGDSQLAKALDMQGEFNMLGNFLTLASVVKANDAVDTVDDRLETPEEKERFFITTVDTAVENSNIYLLKRAIQYSGSDKVLAKKPDTIESLLSNYELPDETKAPRQQDLDDLLEVLVLLNPDWDKYSRNGVLVTDLGVFASAGEPAKSVFNLNAVYREYYMFLEAYPSEDLMALAKRNYPRTGLPIAA